MNDIKCVCCSGWVDSDDGDYHFITASRVALLYGLNSRKCILLSRNGDEQKTRGFDKDRLLYLHPRDDGSYKNLGGVVNGSK